MVSVSKSYWGLFFAKLEGISTFSINGREGRMNKWLYFFSCDDTNILFHTFLCQSSAQMNPSKYLEKWADIFCFDKKSYLQNSSMIIFSIRIISSQVKQILYWFFDTKLLLRQIFGWLGGKSVKHFNLSSEDWHWIMVVSWASVVSHLFCLNMDMCWSEIIHTWWSCMQARVSFGLVFVTKKIRNV